MDECKNVRELVGMRVYNNTTTCGLDLKNPKVCIVVIQRVRAYLYLFINLYIIICLFITHEFSATNISDSSGGLLTC